MAAGIRRLVKKILPASMRAKYISFRQMADHVMQAHEAVYNQDYYEEVELWAVQSAAIMAKSILESFQPKTRLSTSDAVRAHYWKRSAI